MVLERQWLGAKSAAAKQAALSPGIYQPESGISKRARFNRAGRDRHSFRAKGRNQPFFIN